jgi:NAD(P)-dependent dehydrogenase (short-subunit alcohol dehydrogenase family)
LKLSKVALITGASAGIGKATARLLAGKGYTVYAAARRVEKMRDLEEDGIKLLSMDVTDNDSMEQGVNQILENDNRIDVLVNNAGYGSYGALEDVPLSEARYQFEVNIFGLARLIQLVLPGMRGRRSGRIINISSIGGRFGEPHGGWYHATKFALEGLSDSLRMELKEFNIDVVVIQPGAIKTEWSEIARKKLLETSGKSAYAILARKHAGLLAKADKMGSNPDVIARITLKAVRSRKPKTRYAAGAGAGTALFLGRILSDRMFDRFMLRIMR